MTPRVRHLSALMMVCGAACSAPGPRNTTPPVTDISPVGTYAIDAGPAAGGDSSVLEIVETAGRRWGRWVRHGNHAAVGVKDVVLVGSGLSATLDMEEGPARLELSLATSGAFSGEWSRGAEHIPFRGRRRDRVPSPELRELAAVERLGVGPTATDSGASFGTLSPDGLELFYTVHPASWSPHRIVVSRWDGSQWSPPASVPFSTRYNDREPKLSPDGRQLFFSSNRPTDSGGAPRRDLDLWVAERGANGRWLPARHLSAPVNSAAQDFCPVVARNGTLYFISTRPVGGAGDTVRTHRVWRAVLVDDRYLTPQPLGPAVSIGLETNVYVTPDERLMFVSRDGAPDGFGGDDIYVSVSRNRVWQPMQHLGPPVNSFAYEYGPAVSPDGRSLLFTSARRGSPELYRIDLSQVVPR